MRKIIYLRNQLLYGFILIAVHKSKSTYNYIVFIRKSDQSESRRVTVSDLGHDVIDEIFHEGKTATNASALVHQKHDVDSIGAASLWGVCNKCID